MWVIFMETMAELTEYVAEKAKDYLEETGETIEKFPASIVDFVIEYVSNNCNFPQHFKEDNIVADLEKGKTSLAMACVDIYAKVGAEGQTSHGENGISRSYQSSWITFDIVSHFPNYVKVLS